MRHPNRATPAERRRAEAIGVLLLCVTVTIAGFAHVASRRQFELIDAMRQRTTALKTVSREPHAALLFPARSLVFRTSVIASYPSEGACAPSPHGSEFRGAPLPICSASRSFGGSASEHPEVQFADRGVLEADLDDAGQVQRMRVVTHTLLYDSERSRSSAPLAERAMVSRTYRPDGRARLDLRYEDRAGTENPRLDIETGRAWMRLTYGDGVAIVFRIEP